MSTRGRTASLPPTDHRRPERVTSDGLVVHHYNQNGRCKDYDFSVLPVSGPMQRSLAALFAARCTPHHWAVHGSSEHYWCALMSFTAFLSALDHPPRDLDELTSAVIARRREGLRRLGGYAHFAAIISLLRDDARLQTGRVADELARRVTKPKSRTQSYSEAEFDRITLAARRMFRTALLRIEENARHLQRWRQREFTEDSRDWVIGEGLDILARTGDLPRYTDTDGNPNIITKRYSRAMGGTNTIVTWQRLFLSRMEATALGVLLLAEYGWNLSVIDTAAVPRASPDPGDDGCPTYRIPLNKQRRNASHRYETRNVTDDGATSQGRLITHALQATHFARAYVEDQAPGTDRLIIWRSNQSTRQRHSDQDGHPAVGAFHFGVHKDAAQHWSRTAGFSGSPFRRGRRTVIAVDRREPGQHSQNTHDRHYLLVDKRVQEQAVEVIAAGAQDAADHARTIVQVAELREEPTPGDAETATADCSDYDNSPYLATESGCGASFLTCLGCTNAHVHPGHHSRLAHLRHGLSNLRSVLPPATWEADWGAAHARLDDLKSKIGDSVWTQAHSRVTDTDRDLIDHLLTGALDT